MIEELRYYVAVPGKRDALMARFKDDTMSLFEKHGIEVVSFWTVRDKPDDLYYVCRFTDDAARKTAWKAFLGDPDWEALKQRTEAAGPIVASLTSTVIEPVPWL